MGTWKEDVIAAVESIGGKGHYSKIYEAVQQVRGTNLPKRWQAIVRRTIETNSADSEAYDGKNNLFYTVEGIGKGVWGLHDYD